MRFCLFIEQNGSNQISSYPLTILNSGDRGGSVSVRDIADALAGQDIVVEKRMVLLKEPIKAIGSHNVPIRVYKNVEPEIIVEIVPEQFDI